MFYTRAMQHRTPRRPPSTARKHPNSTDCVSRNPTMQTYHFGHLTLPSFSTAHVALVRDLGNASAILEDVKSGGQRFGDMPMALVDARMITSADHILVAVHQAMLRNARGHQESAGSRGLRTKSIHSEVLWNLSATNNVNQSDKVCMTTSALTEHPRSHVDRRIFSHIRPIHIDKGFTAHPHYKCREWRRPSSNAGAGKDRTDRGRKHRSDGPGSAAGVAARQPIARHSGLGGDSEGVSTNRSARCGRRGGPGRGSAPGMEGEDRCDDDQHGCDEVCCIITAQRCMIRAICNVYPVGQHVMM